MVNNILLFKFLLKSYKTPDTVTKFRHFILLCLLFRFSYRNKSEFLIWTAAWILECGLKIAEAHITSGMVWLAPLHRY